MTHSSLIQKLCRAACAGSIILVLTSCAGGPRQTEPLQIQARSVWDSLGKPPAGLVPHSRGITNIVIHHTETPNEPASAAARRIASIRRHHTGTMGWRDVAYHYFIAPDGVIYQGRDERFRADTGAGYPLDGALTITLLGDFRRSLPTEAALGSLRALVLAKRAAHGLSASAVSTHGRRSGGRTDCPGPAFQAWLDAGGLERLNQGGKPARAPRPGAPPHGLSRT